LIAHLATKTRIRVGKLGEAEFPAGYYVYCGSALGSLGKRISRHLSPSKRLHWHIDFLLAAAEVKDVWCLPSEERLECRLSDRVSGMKGAKLIMRRFGASDCKCKSHLWFFPRRPDGLGPVALLDSLDLGLTGAETTPLHFWCGVDDCGEV
jgi:sugar fermentation stimulation protein A